MDAPQAPASLLFEHYLEEDSDLISFPSDIARRRVAVVGNYTPQKCGIATFTGDLVEQLNRFRPELEIDVYALEGKGEDLCCGGAVKAIYRSNPEDCIGAADAINASGADAVRLQHEFGIFGGPDGGMVCAFVV